MGNILAENTMIIVFSAKILLLHIVIVLKSPHQKPSLNRRTNKFGVARFECECYPSL